MFADIEYSGVVDELAAKAKAGGFEAHHEALKTARLISESSPREDLPEDESENMDLEWEAHFEILTLDEGNTGLQILGTGLAGERDQKEPSIPDAGILIADPIGSVTMDEFLKTSMSQKLRFFWQLLNLSLTLRQPILQWNLFRMMILEPHPLLMMARILILLIHYWTSI